MDTLAKQLDDAKLLISSHAAAIEKADSQIKEMATEIVAKSAQIETMKAEHATAIQTIKDESENKIINFKAESEKLVAQKASELAATVGHPAVASAPTAASQPLTAEETWKAYHAIKDPVKQTEFYRSHKELWPIGAV